MRKNYTGYAWELWAYATYPFLRKNTPEKKFFIFGTGRNGSSLLVNLLDNHQMIQCNGELLLRKVLFPKRYIQIKEKLTTKQIYGFKLLSAHFEYQGIENGKEFIAWLIDNGYQMISLRRKSLFRQAVSHVYAKQRHRYHEFKSNEVTRSIVQIPTEELFAELTWMNKLRKLEDQILAEYPAFLLYYEDDLMFEDAQQKCVDRVCAFLGIPSTPVSSDLIRITPDDPRKFIENYDEVCKFIEGTEYSKYLFS
jgi:hypothetical protein